MISMSGRVATYLLMTATTGREMCDGRILLIKEMDGEELALTLSYRIEPVTETAR